MLNIQLLNDDIIEALNERGHTDTDISKMDVLRAFEEYCNWAGLIGWGAQLLSVVKELQEAADYES